MVDDVAHRDQYEALQTIDAKGQYVMPGLWDNHVHFRGGDTLIQENKNLLPLFLAYGITTVRDAGGDITPAVLSWREEIRNRTLDGPTLFTSGPKLDGSEPAWEGSIKVETEADIEPALDSLQALGADYVKMYDGNLTKEMYYGIIQAAEKRELKTTGHMPLSANILEAIDYGLDGSEHLYYTLKACSPLADSLTQLGLEYGMMDPLAATYDSQLAAQAYAKMSAHNVFVTLTNYIGKILSEILDTDHSQDTLRPYIGSGIQQTYQLRIEGAKRARARGSDLGKKMEEVFSAMVLPMQEAGVNFLAGSDCGPFNSFVYPGESLHGELRILVDAGLTPQQALQTSIINGPKFFGLEKYYGSVGEGKMADLILLEKNPLSNIENTGSITAVIARGKVYTKTALNEMLRSVKR